VIRLDPARTPVENAQAFYERHRRARRAAAGVPRRLAESEALLATLDQLAADLALAEDRPAIDAVYEALREAGYVGRPLPRRAVGRSGPLRVVSSDGLAVLVGRNSRQNETVTFERGKRGDRWLHARDVPGAHVLIKSAGRPVPERTLREAAALAAWFSAARDQAAVDVAVTDVRHVRRRRGAGPGMVTFRNEETLTVRPEPVLL
jgi:predicted ribosome quality control (RQC) complex YloA/Tae2 family protein